MTSYKIVIDICRKMMYYNKGVQTAMWFETLLNPRRRMVLLSFPPRLQGIGTLSVKSEGDFFLPKEEHGRSFPATGSVGGRSAAAPPTTRRDRQKRPPPSLTTWDRKKYKVCARTQNARLATSAAWTPVIPARRYRKTSVWRFPAL